MVKRYLFICIIAILSIPNLRGKIADLFWANTFVQTSSDHKQKEIAILYISTGRYILFWDQFYQATEKYFLPKHKKTYFLFTDHMELEVPDNVVKIYTAQEPWPYITLKRYHFFSKQKNLLKKFDYIFFMNGNLIFQTPILDEVLPSTEQGLMVTIHPGFYGSNRQYFTYDTNPKSKAYIDANEGKYYFMGGFNGGISSEFLKMSETICQWTDTDLSNNVIPLWHDESMLNRYMINYMNTRTPLILTPEYATPEEGKRRDGNIKGVLLNKRKWGHNHLRQIET